MQAENVLGYMMTVLSLMSTLLAIYGKPGGMVSGLLVSAAILFAVTLIYLLRSEQNKMYSLQALSQDGHSMAIRLLLVYYRLLRSPSEINRKFQAGKLHVLNAHYHYRIASGDNSLRDIVCEFEFCIKRTFQKEIHVLIAQNRGTKIETLSYTFTGECEHPAALEAIRAAASERDGNFVGLCRAIIVLPKRVWYSNKKNPKKLTVKFVMKGAYCADKAYEPFFICPFIYAKKMHSLEVTMDMTKVPPTHLPALLSPICYPYDGTRYMPVPVISLLKNGSVWHGTIAKCRTNAVYFLVER